MDPFPGLDARVSAPRNSAPSEAESFFFGSGSSVSLIVTRVGKGDTEDLFLPFGAGVIIFFFRVVTVVVVIVVSISVVTFGVVVIP